MVSVKRLRMLRSLATLSLFAKSFNFTDRCSLGIETRVSHSIAREVFHDVQALKSDGSATPHVSVTIPMML